MQPTNRSNTFPTCASPSRSRAFPSGQPRTAFSLVELLVVIVILSMLTGLIGVAASRALAAARTAAIKAEIDMLHMAIMNYKNEYGSFPPCISQSAVAAPSDFAGSHVRRLFPRTTNIANEVTAAVTPANALIGWLTGYSNNPAQPVSAGNRKSLFAFDKSRTDVTGAIYFPSDKPGSPYIYIDNSVYIASGGVPGKWPLAGSGGLSYVVSGKTYTISELQYATQTHPATGAYFNPESFQILSAGRDEEFGNDDDLSNFWPSTRKDFKDSLSQ